MKKSLTLLMLLVFLAFGNTSKAQTEPLIGQIAMFAGNFAPRGWAFCDGQLLPINQNQALFSILGTTYGGDGRTTFALPDLRSRAPIHAGARGIDYNGISLGQKGGAEFVELRKANFLEKHSGKSYESYTIRSGTDKLNTRGPYLGINYIIALRGIFPSRN